MATAPLTTHARVRMQQRVIRFLGAYAVVGGDDAVIAVGHRVGRWRGDL